MTADVELPPLPEATMKSYQTDSTMRTMTLYSYSASDMRAYARANVAHAVAPLQAEIEALRAEALREALEEIRSRSSMNLAMRSDPFELTAMLGDIHQIADAALSRREASND